MSALEETFGATGTLLRETKGEVVLVSRLCAALERLNPALPPDAITAAVDELTRDRSAMSLEAANREVYLLLKDGIKVSVPDRERGGQKTERLRVIDWEQPANNDFLLVSQFSVTGALYTCRPDLVGFVNGLPLVVIELKKPGVPARAAFDENLTHYKAEIPQLFWFNALLIASNGTDSRVGSLTADWERFFEWKRIEREDEPRRVSLEVMLRGTCDRTRLLDLIENFTLFSEHKAGLVKIIAQNHQYLGVNNTVASMLKARTLGHGRDAVAPHQPEQDPRRLRGEVRGVDRELQRGQPEHRGVVRGIAEVEPQPERGATTPRPRKHQRGRTGDLRHPDAPCARVERRRARRGEESRPRPAEPAQATAGAQLAAEIHRPLATQAHHRRRARHRPARAYDKPLYAQKCSALFEHIFESYPERDTGGYATAM